MDYHGYNEPGNSWAQLAHSHNEAIARAQTEVFPYTDMQDHKSMYSEGFAGNEDYHSIIPSLQRHTSTYDDPYSDVVSTFEMPPPTEAGDGDTPVLDRNSNLLTFNGPVYNFPLLTYVGTQTTLLVSAQLHGMFLLAQSATGDAQMPSELTCYRRNLFQINGDVIMPRNLRYILTPDGEQIAIMSTELTVIAQESLEGNPIRLVVVPWKTATNAGQASDDQAEKEPMVIPLDNAYTQDSDSEYAKIPFSWKRLQFRIATANNGRRKELQQHFLLKVRVMATLATGGKICICELQSGSLIVRGRSPRNFQSRKDMPLNGGSVHGRKARTMSGETAKEKVAPTSAPIQDYQQQYAESEVQINVEPAQAWQEHSQIRFADPTALSPAQSGNVYPASSPGKAQFKKSPIQSSMPLSLLLVEDETPKTISASQTPPDRRTLKRIQVSPRPPSFSLNTLSSPDESADLLYEYFPLSLEDWMAPHEAIYRPHAVHHIRTKVPEATHAMKSKSKRMYVE